LIPLFAVETVDAELLDMLPRFRRRMDWFVQYRPQLIRNVCPLTKPGKNGRRLISIVDREKLERVMRRMLDPAEFLSAYGLRSLSKVHEEHPFTFEVGETEPRTVAYEPGESRSGIFGGNSNWRGPIWYPVNYLMIESLRKYHEYYGDTLTVEMPAGTGHRANLEQVGQELARRVCAVFLRDAARGGRRPVFGDVDLFQSNDHWRDHLLFYEYFHGETGAGLGASHQTGWTALVAKLIQDCGGTA
jgi:hypothetical protein